MKSQYNNLFMAILLHLACIACSKEEVDPIIEKEEIVTIAENLMFAEGPAYLNGKLYFSDIEANIIYSWTDIEGVQIVKENSGGANGMFSDNSENLFICEGSNKRVTQLNIDGEETIMAEFYENSPFNEPNDVWVSANGYIYFTDPVFKGTQTQVGEDVYCIIPGTKEVIKVADDLVKPNGIVGNMSGTKIYIADYGASKIYSYSIKQNGQLINKQLFASVQADGLSIDSNGNIYAAGDVVYIFDSLSNKIGSIEVNGSITNVLVVEDKLVFITTHNAVYKKTYAD